MQELPFLRSARRLMLIDICMKFREDSLRGFQVTERTRFVTDRQTDRRTPGEKQYVSQPFGGRHNEFKYLYTCICCGPNMNLVRSRVCLCQTGNLTWPMQISVVSLPLSKKLEYIMFRFLCLSSLTSLSCI